MVEYVGLDGQSEFMERVVVGGWVFEESWISAEAEAMVEGARPKVGA